jgi:HEAT repeat protein
MKPRLIPFILICMISCNTADPLADSALHEIRSVLRSESLFVKVHAAEYLIWLGYAPEAKQAYLAENERHQTETPYRIGIWRVLAESAENAAEKEQWTNKIFKVFGDRQAPDRLHAAETLAKLQQSPLEKYPGVTRETLASGNRNLATYTRWATSYSSAAAMKEGRSEFLRMAANDPDSIVRKISAFILRKIKGLSADEWKALAAQALSEPDSTGMRRSLLNTVFVTLPEGLTADEKVKQEMLTGHEHFSVAEKTELALALAEKGTEQELPVLSIMLHDGNADVRATAAYAILKIKEH